MHLKDQPKYKREGKWFKNLNKNKNHRPKSFKQKLIMKKISNIIQIKEEFTKNKTLRF